MPEKVKWKKCPSCKGFIPESWNRHKKCGWKEVSSESSVALVSSSANEDLPKPERVSEPEHDIPKKIMENSINDISSMFDMSRKELKEAISKDSGFAQIINTLFIARIKR